MASSRSSSSLRRPPHVASRTLPVSIMSCGGDEVVSLLSSRPLAR
ncbi:hypothetical protein CCHR01_18782 [Colletotrichum chrysophilum]|uniref:Uncharacterized protein n=1 Tax=Colletotrichum chrysophilum TaxID=1836956 RepID=A0AAD8ZZG2_9PEZI|nr:hypothetical protein CCHR01_18782 [Colletotrichum chrysophilum]